MFQIQIQMFQMFRISRKFLLFNWKNQLLSPILQLENPKKFCKYAAQQKLLKTTNCLDLANSKLLYFKPSWTWINAVSRQCTQFHESSAVKQQHFNLIPVQHSELACDGLSNLWFWLLQRTGKGPMTSLRRVIQGKQCKNRVLDLDRLLLYRTPWTNFPPFAASSWFPALV